MKPLTGTRSFTVDYIRLFFKRLCTVKIYSVAERSLYSVRIFEQSTKLLKTVVESRYHHVQGFPLRPSPPPFLVPTTPLTSRERLSEGDCLKDAFRRRAAQGFGLLIILRLNACGRMIRIADLFENERLHIYLLHCLPLRHSIAPRNVLPVCFVGGVRPHMPP